MTVLAQRAADEEMTRKVEHAVAQETQRAERDFDEFIRLRRVRIVTEYRATQRRLLLAHFRMFISLARGLHRLLHGPSKDRQDSSAATAETPTAVKS